MCGPQGLNSGLDAHPRSRCFVDVNSPLFKPEVRQRRLQAKLDKGEEIPKWILD